MTGEVNAEVTGAVVPSWAAEARAAVRGVLSPSAMGFEAVVALVQAWMATAAQESRNMEYYRGVLDEVAEVLGEDAYLADDGSVSDSPLRARIPQLVAQRLNWTPKPGQWVTHRYMGWTHQVAHPPMGFPPNGPYRGGLVWTRWPGGAGEVLCSETCRVRPATRVEIDRATEVRVLPESVL
jgi:hypothetical protein